MNDQSRAEVKLPRIHDIPIDQIDEFPDHPFHVRMDEDMDQLVESIKTRGIITPVTLRQKEDGRQVLQAHPELRTRLLESPRPIKSRSNSQIPFSVESINPTPARQAAVRKAAVQQAEKRIALRKQEVQQLATEHQTQQTESVKQASPGQPASEATPVQTQIESAGLHNHSASVQGNRPTAKEPTKAIPIKDKSRLPIRTKPDAVRSSAPTVGRASTKSVSQATSEKAKTAAITSIQKSRKAATTARQTALYAAKKAAELTAKMAKAAAQAASDLYAAIVAGGGIAILVIVVVVLIGCGAAIFGMQEDQRSGEGAGRQDRQQCFSGCLQPCQLRRHQRRCRSSG